MPDNLFDKKVLRRTILHYRQLLSNQEWSKRNDLLLLQVKSFLSENEASRIHVFLPIKKNREPDLTQILPWIYNTNHQVITSVTDFKARKMHHYQIGKDTILQENALGIPEPVQASPVNEAKIDLVFVPLLIADKQGNRIGYGGGFYDRFLSETNATKVGLSTSPAVDEIYQKEQWDQPLDFLITPNNTYQYGKNSI